MAALGALWWLVAAQVAAPAAPPPPTSAEPAPASQIGGTRFHGAFELSGLSLTSEPPAKQQDLYAVLTPLIGVDGGGDFAFELGAELRLLLFGGDFGLRKQDWDEASDFGQILRNLRVGSEASNLQLKAGPLENYTLGWGHLINHYGDRLNPDYHPSGLRLLAFLGPTRDEVMVSDFLGARIFAGEVALDLGRIFSASPLVMDRFHIVASAAYDAGRAGSRAPVLGLANIDLDAALYRGPVLQLFAEAGSGGRVDIKQTSVSGVAGVAADAQLSGPRLTGKLEIRKQGGTFRQGMVGPSYELSRFSDVGLSGAPIASAALPDGFSGYAEFGTAFGTEAPGDWAVHFSLAAEHYFWGRTDGDASVSARLFSGHLVASAKVIAVGVGESPRYSGQAEVRWRFAPSFYALGYAGTVYYPQPDSTLAAGGYAGVGAAVDFNR